MTKLRETLSQGLDKEAMAAYAEKVDKMAEKGTMTTELAKMVAGADFMPMVSEAVSYRYSCRRTACRYIPPKETQWIIATSMDGTGKHTKWYCPACGLEYKHAIRDGPEDSIGQDLRFNYVVFMQFEMKHGRHTFCAMAAAPCDFLNNILTTLKLVLAYSKIKFNKGAQVAITDMMTLSNEMFVEAMKGFPKITLKIKKPVHHSMGEYIKIVGNGVESLQEKGHWPGLELPGHERGVAKRLLRKESEDLGRRGLEIAYRLRHPGLGLQQRGLGQDDVDAADLEHAERTQDESATVGKSPTLRTSSRGPTMRTSTSAT